MIRAVIVVGLLAAVVVGSAAIGLIQALTDETWPDLSDE